MILVWITLGVAVLTGLVILAVKWDKRDAKETPVETDKDSDANAGRLVLPWRYNEKGELLDRLSGEPVHRFPLF